MDILCHRCCFHSRWVKPIPPSDSTLSLWTAAPSQPNSNRLTVSRRGTKNTLNNVLTILAGFLLGWLAPALYFAFPQRLLRHHGPMGDSGEAERPLGESSPEHVHTLAVRRHDERLWKGERVDVRQQVSGKVLNLTPGVFFLSKPSEIREDVGEVAWSAGECVISLRQRRQCLHHKRQQFFRGDRKPASLQMLLLNRSEF